MKTDTYTIEEQEQLAHTQEMEEARKAIADAFAVGREVCSVVGTIATGATTVVCEGKPLNGLSTLNVVATSRDGSVSTLSFLLEQVVDAGGPLQVNEITRFNVEPPKSNKKSQIIGTFSLPRPKTKSTFRVVLMSAPFSPAGTNNFRLNVSGS